MSKIWWLVLIVGGLLYPTKALALPPILDCGWCGNSCGEVKSGTVCPMVAPPDNQSCVNLSGKCVVQEKEFAGEGQVCGGIKGIMCDKGLTCKYGKTGDTRNLGKPIVADETGVCVRDMVGTLGDANKDGKADLVDFTIWKKESMLRVQGPDASADFDGNGQVNSADFLVWRSSYLVIKK